MTDCAEEFVFEDADPEDAWDDGDPEEDKLDILERVVEALRQVFHGPRRDDALRLVGKLSPRKRASQDRLDAVRDALEAM